MHHCIHIVLVFNVIKIQQCKQNAIICVCAYIFGRLRFDYNTLCYFITMYWALIVPPLISTEKIKLHFLPASGQMKHRANFSF